MKSNEKKFIYTCICVSFVILYIFLATKPLLKRIQLEPHWTISITENIDKKLLDDDKKDILHFKLGQNIGSFTKDGTINQFHPFPYKAAISDTYYSLFTSDATHTPVYNFETSKKLFELPAGFPFFKKDRIFLFRPGGNSITEFDNTGKEKWSIEDAAIILSIDASMDKTVCGFSNGRILCIGNDGTIITDFFPGGSEYEIIFSTAISNDGKYIAALCGIEKQRIIIAQITDTQPKIIYHSFLDSELKEQSFSTFNQSSTIAFFNVKDALISVEKTTSTSKHIPIDGKILSMKECKSDQEKPIYCFLIKTNTGYSVLTLDYTAKKIGSFSFKAKSAFIATKDSSLFVGKDATISRIDMIKK